MKYYAVHKGHKKGVFNDWSECQLSISGYSGAVFKKCDTCSEANYFSEYGKLPIKKYERLDKFFGGSDLNKKCHLQPTPFFFRKKKNIKNLVINACSIKPLKLIEVVKILKKKVSSKSKVNIKNTKQKSKHYSTKLQNKIFYKKISSTKKTLLKLFS